MKKIDYTEVQDKIVKQANQGLTKNNIDCTVQKKIDDAKVEKSTYIETALSFFKK